MIPALSSGRTRARGGGRRAAAARGHHPSERHGLALDCLEKELRGAGVRIGLDDFGTGYSSFSYLKRFAVDSLKIDRSAILAISQGLGPGAVVEGVEEQPQLEPDRLPGEGVAG